MGADQAVGKAGDEGGSPEGRCWAGFQWRPTCSARPGSVRPPVRSQQLIPCWMLSSRAASPRLRLIMVPLGHSARTHRAGHVGACVRDRRVSHPGEKQLGPAAGSVTRRGNGRMQASGQGPRLCVSRVAVELLEGRNRVGMSPDHRRLSLHGPQLPTGETDPNCFVSLLEVLCSGTAEQAVIDKLLRSLGGLLRGCFWVTSRSSLDQFATC